MAVDLDFIIRTLQAFREQVGNVEVWHHDAEWGLTEANPGLCKMLPYIKGEAVMQWPLESVLAVKRAIAAHSMKDAEDAWDNDEIIRSLWFSKSEYLEAEKQTHLERLDFLRRFDEAPFAVVF